MPRTVAFKPRETPKGWEITIPASQSETGNRRKIYFKTETAANKEAAKRKRDMRKDGARAVKIAPGLADQAIKADAMLAPYGVPLVEAVRGWVEMRREQENSITLAEAWDRAEAYRVDHAATTRKDLTRTRGKMPPRLLGKLVCDITREDCEEALRAATPGAATFRTYHANLRLVINDAIKDEFASRNPADKVRLPATAAKEVKILTSGQINDVFNACVDYRVDGSYDRINELDCRNAESAFAFLAFSGIRPAELTRLTWDDVSVELRNIRIPAAKAKTRTLRNVHIEDNLAAWIEAVPPALRFGKITPPDWNHRRALVMRHAGLKQSDNKDQDLFRHSYGSHHIAAFGDMEALNSNMGHSHVKTFFNHYHHALTKREALPYWEIAPEGIDVENIKAAS